MAILNITKIKAFKLGSVQEDGSLPATWEDNLNVKEGTCVLEIPEQDSNPMYNEQSTVPFADLSGNISSPSVVGMLSQAALLEVSTLFGGSYEAAGTGTRETIKLSSAPATVFKSIYLEGENSDGEDVFIGVPNAQIKMSISGTLTKTDVTGVMFKGSILNPKTGNDFVHILAGPVGV